MIRKVFFGALTPCRMESRQQGRVFLAGLLESAPEWAPEKYNCHEPVNRIFDASNLEEALDAWQWSFLWTRKQPRVTGSVFANRNVHGSVYIESPEQAFDPETARRLMARLATDFGVDLGYVHVSHEADSHDRDRYRRAVEPFVAGLTTHRLRNGLPDVSWAMLFGARYVELFGRERLLTIPAARVEETGHGVFVQLTPNVGDVAARREAYLAAQQAARQHLDNGAFAGESSGDNLRVPEFFRAAQ